MPMISPSPIEVASGAGTDGGQRPTVVPAPERTARLLDQMEFELEDLEATATEDELRAEQEAEKAPERAHVAVGGGLPSLARR